MSRLSHIALDDSALPPPTPELDQECRVAIFDLLEANHFDLPASVDPALPPGPYRLELAVDAGRLTFALETEGHEKASEFQISLSPLRQAVKDYRQICRSYFEAVKTLPPSRIEAIDTARRGIHDEAARLLAERLEGRAEADDDTARRLFTLICALHRDE